MLYNEYREHELERYITRLCLYWMVYVFLMYIFKCMSCSNEAPRFFYFLYMNALSSNYMGYQSDGNNTKATGGVKTFIH